MSEDPIEAYFSRLAEHAATAPVSTAEAEAILDLAREVAHGVERRFAPIAAYATGRALAADADPAEREAAIRAVIAVVRRMPT